MEYTGKLYGEGGIPLMLTASDVDALESMHSRLCAALGLPEDSEPETVAEAVEARRVVVPNSEARDCWNCRSYQAGAANIRCDECDGDLIPGWEPRIRANQGGAEHA